MTESSIRKQIRGRGLPLRGNDIDTDRIIPARYLLAVTFDDLGNHAFADDRAAAGHPFDQPRHQGSRLLVVNENFGCGSSREHAPQALMRWGIDAFVGQSFAEIFFGNCVALGLPCLTAKEVDVVRLQTAIEQDPSQEVGLDVGAQTVHFSGGTIQGTIPDGPREQFLTGTWDALGQLLEAGGAIAATRQRLPYVNGFRVG